MSLSSKEVTVVLEIPDALSVPLQKQFGDLSRRALEDLAVDGYKSGVLSSAEVGRMLGHTSRWDTDEFLKNHETWLHYSAEDLRNELRVMEEKLGNARG